MKTLTLLLLLSAALSMRAAQIDTIAFNPTQSTIAVGDTLHLELDIGPLTQYVSSDFTQVLSYLYAWSLEIDFDPTVFQALDVNEGAFLPATGATNFFSGLIDNTGGSISFISESLSGSTIGAYTALNGGSLLTADFQAIATSSGSTFSIAPGSCFQNVQDVSSFGCTISTWLDTSTTATITVTDAATVDAPEPGTFAYLATMSALGLALIACSRLPIIRRRSGASRGMKAGGR
jgi:hypothetical protein